MPGSDVFGSGSADINPAYEHTLQQVADAMTKVPGSVTIVGHTDNQPIRSLRFRDNDELSRERAESVAAVLRKTMTAAPNFRIRGAGMSQPAALPESDPQNRARNRRVEIIHVR
jgi:type VI secretion system protein ImpK